MNNTSNPTNITTPSTNSQRITESTAAKYTIALITVTFFARILIAAYTGLGIGESYYFRGALNLSLSYFDQPPLFFLVERTFN